MGSTEIHERLDSIEWRLRALREELDEVRRLAPAAGPAAAPTRPVRPPARPPGVAPTPAPHRPAPPPPARRPAPPARPAGPSLVERAAALARAELSGPRAFALAGGIVTLLGVVFLFVLAANRGWIGPAARVSIGATASLAVLLAGVALRIRFGRTHASLASVGTGIAGGYATLAAATIVYGFLPSWGALLVAAAIATSGGVLATRWSSEILAGLSLVGAASAPGLVALDDGIGAPGTAFAVVVLAAALAAAAARRWLWLVVAVGATALGQVIWLTAVAAPGDGAAIAVVAATSLVLLGGGLASQAASDVEGLDPFAASLVLAGGGVALGALGALAASDRAAGVAILAAAAVYAAAGLVVVRRRRDLAWTAGAVALLLAGVATSYLLSGQSLTVAWAGEAAVLAALAWRLSATRLQLASLAYLGLGVAHSLIVDLRLDAPVGDLPAGAAPGFFALAVASLVVASLAPGRRGDRSSTGMLAGLEPLWNGLVAHRGSLRFSLSGSAVAFAVAGSAALASGRWLTIAWAGAAAVLGLAAFQLGERRLQGAALAFVGLAAIHALAVEAPSSTLALARGLDPLAPVPSLAALAAATAVLAALAAFPTRGIAFLGPLEEYELLLEPLARNGRQLRRILATAAATAAAWAVSLLLVAASYEPGQAGATALWATLGVVAAALAARRRSTPLLVAAAGAALFAFGKAATFDWAELGAEAAAAAVLVGAAALLLLGFFGRYAIPDASGLEAGSLIAAAVAAGSAVAAVDLLVPGETRVLGAAALGVAAAVGAVAALPHRARRRGRPEPWLRNLATVYWSVGLVVAAVGESLVVEGRLAATATLWALSAAAAASAARPLAEDRLWLAGGAGVLVASGACLALVTVPSRLVVASAHPGDGLWALAACVASLAWIARLAPAAFARARTRIALLAAGLGLFGLSLGVLEAAERVSRASVEVDFQRGHTAVSALWGAVALALFAAGLVRNSRLLQRVGLVLFGLALAKLFLYDLRTLSSISRALSFLAVGAILLAAAFLVERIVHGGRGVGGRPDRAPS